MCVPTDVYYLLFLCFIFAGISCVYASCCLGFGSASIFGWCVCAPCWALCQVNSPWCFVLEFVVCSTSHRAFGWSHGKILSSGAKELRSNRQRTWAPQLRTVYLTRLGMEQTCIVYRYCNPSIFSDKGRYISSWPFTIVSSIYSYCKSHESKILSSCKLPGSTFTRSMMAMPCTLITL
jgi:hypothetical protein